MPMRVHAVGLPYISHASIVTAHGGRDSVSQMVRRRCSSRTRTVVAMISYVDGSPAVVARVMKRPE